MEFDICNMCDGIMILNQSTVISFYKPGNFNKERTLLPVCPTCSNMIVEKLRNKKFYIGSTPYLVWLDRQKQEQMEGMFG